MIEVQRDNRTRPAGPAGRRRSWPVKALLVLGGWLLVSPLVLSTTRVTAGKESAVGAGLVLAVLAAWAWNARDRVPPLAIAAAVGVWLVLAPWLWEFGDGVDSTPGLVPIPPSEVTEPTRAVIARAGWNSVLAGLLTLAVAGSVLLAARRQARSAASAGTERPQVEAPGGQR